MSSGSARRPRRATSGRHRGRRLAVLLSVAVVGVLVPASSAFASTLTSDGQNVNWTADSGAGANQVFFEEPSARDLAIYTSGDPVEYDDEAGTNNAITSDCDDNDGTPMDGIAEEVLCDGIDRSRPTAVRAETG